MVAYLPPPGNVFLGKCHPDQVMNVVPVDDLTGGTDIHIAIWSGLVAVSFRTEEGLEVGPTGIHIADISLVRNQ